MNRSNYWDTWKGIAIISVILIHATNMASTFSINSFNWLFGLSLRQLTNSAVAIFFALAGFFSHYRPEISAYTFITKRLIRVLPPYIFWSLLFIIILKPEHFSSFGLLVYDFVYGGAISIGYFVVVLVQLIIITPLIWKLKNVFSHLFVIILFFIIGMIYRYIVSIGYPESTLASFPFNLILFITWYPFYHFGIFASTYQSVLKKFTGMHYKKIIIFLVISYFISMAEGYTWAILDIKNFAYSQLKLSSFITSFLLFLFILHIHFHKSETFFNNKQLAWVGKKSYIIYLSHAPLISIISNKINHFECILNFQPLYIFIVFLLTFMVCLTIIILIEKLFSQSLKKLIGL